MKRLCSALLLLVAGCSHVEVQGIVRDQATGDPLPGATVRIGADMTSTDYRGYYEMEVDKEPQQPLLVDKPGYEAFRQDVELEGVEQVIHDVNLNPQLPPVEGGGTDQGGGMEQDGAQGQEEPRPR